MRPSGELGVSPCSDLGDKSIKLLIPERPGAGVGWLSAVNRIFLAMEGKVHREPWPQ